MDLTFGWWWLVWQGLDGWQGVPPVQCASRMCANVCHIYSLFGMCHSAQLESTPILKLLFLKCAWACMCKFFIGIAKCPFMMSNKFYLFIYFWKGNLKPLFIATESIVISSCCTFVMHEVFCSTMRLPRALTSKVSFDVSLYCWLLRKSYAHTSHCQKLWMVFLVLQRWSLISMLNLLMVKLR